MFSRRPLLLRRCARERNYRCAISEGLPHRWSVALLALLACPTGVVVFLRLTLVGLPCFLVALLALLRAILRTALVALLFALRGKAQVLDGCPAKADQADGQDHDQDRTQPADSRYEPIDHHFQQRSTRCSG